MCEGKGAIIEKIRGMLELSKDAANENEAAVAADMARRWMARHGVRAEEIRTEEPELAYADAKRSPKKWEIHLVATVCDFWPVDAVMRGNSRATTACFVGSDIDVRVAKDVFEYLRKTIMRLSLEYTKKIGGNDFDRRSFCAGAVQAVHAKLKERRAAAEQEQKGEEESCFALMCVDRRKEIRSKIEKKNPGLKERQSRKSYVNSYGYAAGVAAGDSIGVDPQISGRSD